MSILCRVYHKWGRWDHWFPLYQTQARHCLRCKKIEVRSLQKGQTHGE